MNDIHNRIELHQELQSSLDTNTRSHNSGRSYDSKANNSTERSTVRKNESSRQKMPTNAALRTPKF